MLATISAGFSVCPALTVMTLVCALGAVAGLFALGCAVFAVPSRKAGASRTVAPRAHHSVALTRNLRAAHA